MTNLWFLLLFKSSVVLGAACLAAHVMRHRTAAARHLVWATAMFVLLILPIGLLVPREVVPGNWVVRMAATPAIGAAGAPGGAVTLVLPEVIWAAGFLLILVRLLTSFFKVRTIISNSSRWRGDGQQVRVASELRGPAAWSFGRGIVLLPACASDWTSSKLRAVLMHEQAHLARRDCESLLAAELACAIYWFHPLVWYAARRLREEQEHAADDSVLESGWEPAEYAEQLLSVASTARAEPLLAGAATQPMLKARVQAILDHQRRRTMLTRKMLIAAITAIAFIAVPLAAMQSGRKIYKVADVVVAPSVINKVEPRYTPEAKEAKIQGTVKLSGVIEVNGTLSDVKVEQSLDEGLDRNAMEAVHQWVFKPGEKDGAPVAVAVNIEINFRLLK